MNKKLSLLSVALMALTLGVTSCENTTTSTTESTSTPASSSVTEDPFGFDPTKNVTITFYSTMGTALMSTFDVYIQKFQELYPNITVDHTGGTSYDTLRDNIKTELSNNQGPNLAYCYPDHVALYNTSKKVQTLDKFINDTTTDENGNLVYGLTAEQQADFVEGYWNEGKAFGDGLMYTLPFSKSTEVLYYNKTKFDELNLSVPTHWFKDDAGLTPETSLEYVCEKLLEADPNCVPLGYDSEANWFINMCEQLQSPYTSTDKNNRFQFDNEVNQNFVTRFKEWYDKKYFTTQEINGSYTSDLFVNTDASKKTSYMSIGSSAGASHQAPDGGTFEVGIASIPQVNPARPRVISQGPSICLFKKADKQQVAASWLFLRYMTTNVELQASFSIASGYVPVIKEVYRNSVYQEHLEGANGYEGITALSSKVCMEQESAYFTSPAFVGSSAARDQVGKLLVSVFSGTATVDEAFKTAIAECIKQS